MMLIDIDLLENYSKIIDHIKNHRFCNSIDEEFGFKNDIVWEIKHISDPQIKVMNRALECCWNKN